MKLNRFLYTLCLCCCTLVGKAQDLLDTPHRLIIDEENVQEFTNWKDALKNKRKVYKLTLHNIKEVSGKIQKMQELRVLNLQGNTLKNLPSRSLRTLFLSKYLYKNGFFSFILLEKYN
jgi:Leucine-rich repeat (LRR) protein